MSGPFVRSPGFDRNAHARSRREFLAGAAGAAACSLLPASFAFAADAPHAQDWQWLVGSWDVWHRRLKDRLAGSDQWEEFPGKSAFWQALGGLGNVDDNIVDIPSGTYRGLSVRAFDPATGTWAIWWLDGAGPGGIHPPVRGTFKGDGGPFTGRDTYKGGPIVMRFRWSDVHGARPWWEQAFSPDDGASWEVNWRNYFTRTAPISKTLPRLEGDPAQARDWDFLAGTWKVRNRRLRQRLVVAFPAVFEKSTFGLPAVRDRSATVLRP